MVSWFRIGLNWVLIEPNWILIKPKLNWANPWLTQVLTKPLNHPFAAAHIRIARENGRVHARMDSCLLTANSKWSAAITGASLLILMWRTSQGPLDADPTVQNPLRKVGGANEKLR